MQTGAFHRCAFISSHSPSPQLRILNVLGEGTNAEEQIIMFQQIILVGNLGSDPEMRYTASGVPVTNFSLAVNKRRTTPEGVTQEKTTWFRISLWRRSAEVASQYLTKGAKIMVIGEIESARPWTDRDGNLQASIEVTANQFQFLDSRNGHVNGAAAEHAATAEVAVATDDPDIPF